MPLPLVIQVMQSHKQALAAQEAQQMAGMARRWSQMETELQDKVELFTRRVAMDGLTPSQLQSRQFQLDRFGSLLRQVRTELDKYTDYVEPLTVNGQRAAAASGIQVAGTAINAVASDAGVRVAFDRLPIQAVENLVGLAGDGSPLRDLLVNSYGAGADGMLNELIKSTTLGSNPRATARNMLRNGLGQSLSRMMNISRTEQLRVGRESTRQAYQKSGVVEAYRRLGTKDRRACVACIMADGETLELTESLNEHPSGRCTLIPIVTGLPLIEWEKGRDWLQKASPDTQKAIMGKGRFAAWQDGKFDLDQLISVRSNSVWGDSLQPTTLADLLGGTARPYTIREPDPNRFVGEIPRRQVETKPAEVAPPVETPVTPIAEPVATVPTEANKATSTITDLLQPDPSAEKIVSYMQSTLNRVHKLPADIKPVPFRVGDIESSATASGVYVTDWTHQDPKEIVLRQRDRMEAVGFHEMGHYLDHQYFLLSRDFRFVRPNTKSSVTDKTRESLWKAVKGSPSWSALDKRREELRTLRTDERGAIIDDNATPEERYLSYLTREDETWARAYAQYVSRKSDRMQQDMQAMGQWPDAEFKKIEKVIDKIIKESGLSLDKP